MDDSLDIALAFHLRFSVQGHILITGGDALIEVFEVLLFIFVID
jgi:hypothetical protein